MEKDNRPITLTPNFYQLGTPDYPAYLSMGDDGMIIEGGISATFPVIVNQIKTLGIEPQRIKYLVITHTHPDHIGAVPRLKKLWPHLKVVASPVAAKILKSEEMVKEFIRLDGIITEILMIRDDITEWPPEFENPTFEVDMAVKEGDRLNLGAGISWAVYDTPGHSPCHISLYNESEAILDIVDAAGLYQPDRDCFWPNYFHSLEAYCDSIRKLCTLPAQIGAHGHGGVVRGDVRHHLQRALEATEAYHREIITRLGNGEDSAKVALEIARKVFTFTHLQPFESILGLTKLMIKRSQSTGNKTELFTIP
jgi:glyoxylase-like metal-dependent hydrolase (beta-lactamase superfamily II)